MSHQGICPFASHPSLSRTAPPLARVALFMYCTPHLFAAPCCAQRLSRALSSRDCPLCHSHMLALSFPSSPTLPPDDLRPAPTRSTWQDAAHKHRHLLQLARLSTEARYSALASYGSCGLERLCDSPRRTVNPLDPPTSQVPSHTCSEDRRTRALALVITPLPHVFTLRGSGPPPQPRTRCQAGRARAAGALTCS